MSQELREIMLQEILQRPHSDNRLQRILSRGRSLTITHRWPLLLAIVAAILLSVSLSGLLAETQWSIEGSLVYGRLPIDESAQKLYSPPDIRTIYSLIESPAILEEAITRGHLDCSARDLEKDLAVEEPRSTQKIGLSLLTSNIDEGVRTLSAVMQACQDHVAAIRRNQLTRNLDDLTQTLHRNDQRIRVARTGLTEFAKRHHVNDPVAEKQALIASVSSLEYQLNSQKVELTGLQAQRDSVQQQLDQQKHELQILEKSAADEAAAAESLADNRRRQDRLNELIREERRVTEVRARLDARQAEYGRKLLLYEKGYLSKNEFELIRSEVQALEAQIREGSRIEQWKAELERIDKVVVPKASIRPPGSPILHQIMFKLVELDLHILNSQESQRQVATVMAENRRRLAQLELFESEQAGLVAEMKAASDERDLLTRQSSALQAVRDMGPVEFSISQPPSPGAKPPISNRWKLLALFTSGLTSLCLMPIALSAVRSGWSPSLLEYCEGIGIVTLTNSALEAQSSNRPSNLSDDDQRIRWCRQMALRLQQLQPESGAVMAFIPSRRSVEDGDADLLLEIGRVLANRDESVLFVDLNSAAPHQATGSGFSLTDFITQPELTFNEVLCTQEQHLHQVFRRSADSEVLFSKRMSDFFRHARSNYSIILTLGPDLEEPTEVEMLTRHASQLILLCEPQETLPVAARQTLDNLCELQAPVAGTAIRIRPPRQKSRMSQQERSGFSQPGIAPQMKSSQSGTSSSVRERIGYLIPEFPGQTHAFFVREREELQRRRIDTVLYSTRKPRKGIATHHWATAARTETTYLMPGSLFAAMRMAWSIMRTGPTAWLRCLNLAFTAEDATLTGRLRTLSLIPAAFRLADCAKRDGWSHIHIHSCANAAWLGVFLRQFSDLTYSLTLHGPLQDYGPNQKLKWKFSSFCVVITEELAAQVRMTIAPDCRPLILKAPMGVDPSAFVRSGAYQPPRPGEVLRLVSCGRIHPCKGHDDLIRAVDLLQQRGIRVELTICGAPDGRRPEYPDELNSLIAERSLQAVVRLAGSVSEEQVRAELQLSHVFCLASHSEPLGVATMEAMAMEMPVVVTSSPGVREMITSGVNGILVPPLSPESIADAICALCAAPEDMRRLAANSRLTIEQRFHSGISAAVIRTGLLSIGRISAVSEQPTPRPVRAAGSDHERTTLYETTSSPGVICQ
jgi:colanic acid/amylovoran biosynthesis glycosyltransferase